MITKSDIEAKLVHIYLKQMQEMQNGSEITEPSQIDFSSNQLSLQDVGINSLGFIRLVVEIENEFQFQFDDDMLNIELFHSIQELVAYIDGKVNQQ